VKTALVPSRSPAAASWVAFRALLLRDLVVLRKTLKEFVSRTVLQPFLLVFVFTYVFPKIGQSVGGSAAAGASRLAGGGGSSGSRSSSGNPIGRAADGPGVRVHA